jgi:phosphopantothenoylcysteine decarboxylase / phosphopantothenate---cysteine ligase
VLIGFAVETEDMESQARQKLAQKQLDFIVANSAGAFDAATNRVTLIANDGKIERFSEMPKTQVAAMIVERAVQVAGHSGSIR